MKLINILQNIVLVNLTLSVIFLCGAIFNLFQFLRGQGNKHEG